MANTKQTVKIKSTSSTGVLKEREFPSNSNAVRKFEARKRGKVLHSGGTRVGSFE